MLGKTEAKEKGDGRRWDGWMASLTQWTGIWANSGRLRRTEESGGLQSMGSRRVRCMIIIFKKSPWIRRFSTFLHLWQGSWEIGPTAIPFPVVLMLDCPFTSRGQTCGPDWQKWAKQTVVEGLEQRGKRFQENGTVITSLSRGGAF